MNVYVDKEVYILNFLHFRNYKIICTEDAKTLWWMQKMHNVIDTR